MIDIGVIGCGYWGPNLIRNFYQLPDCRMKTCCDLDGKKLDHIKQLYPIVETAMDYRDMLNDPGINAVAIATPVRTHFKLAREFLKSGKHVLVEKPMTTSVTEAEELIELANKKGKILMVDHTFEYSPPVEKMKEIIKAGTLGDILYIRSEQVNLGLFQKDINVIWDMAPHDISIICYLTSQEPKKVTAWGKAHITKGIENITTTIVDFENGLSAFLVCLSAFLTSSWFDSHKIRKMTIVGDKKMIAYDDVKTLEKIKIYDNGGGDIITPILKNEEPLKVMCDHFLECIQQKKAPRSDGKSGLRVVRILEATSKSLSNGGEITPAEQGKKFSMWPEDISL